MKASIRENLMLLLDLLDEKEHGNSQINCIYRHLTALSISSKISTILICQKYTPKVVYFTDAMRFLHMRSQCFFFSTFVEFVTYWHLEYMNNPLIKAMQETETLFASCVGCGDCFRLKKSWLASKADVLLIIRKLQKQVCHLTRISYRE